MAWSRQSPDYSSRQVQPLECQQELLIIILFAGPDTILASHLVGLYCHREIIGQSYGETLEIAEEMAARDALRNILQTAEHSQPRPWGRDLGARDQPNTSIEGLSVEPRNIINC